MKEKNNKVDVFCALLVRLSTSLAEPVIFSVLKGINK